MKQRKRALSMLLVLTLLLSMFPMAAAVDIPPQTLTLPIVAEGDDVPAPQGPAGGGISLFAIEQNQPACTYVYAGKESIYPDRTMYILNPDDSGAYLLDTDGRPASNGIVQMMDGEDVVAQSDALSNYYTTFVDVDGKSVMAYYIGYAEIKDTATVLPGSYSLRLVAGDTIYPIAGMIEVVGADCLLLDYAHVYGLYPGTDDFEISLSVYGFKTDAELEGLSFRLTDGDTTVAQSTGCYRDISARDIWHLYAQMQVVSGQRIESDRYYTLSVDYAGDKLLVDGVGAVIRQASSPRVSIKDISIADPQKAILQVELARLESDQSYTIKARTRDSSIVYAEQTFTAASATETIDVPLTKNGTIQPLSSYDSSFYVEINKTGQTYGEVTELFHNPYYNDRTEHINFYPCEISKSDRAVSFELELYNSRSYKDSGNVLTMRDADGNEVGRCEAITVEKYGSTVILRGTLNITGSLTRWRYDLYLNGVLVDTVWVVDELSLIEIEVPLRDQDDLSFWMNFEQFPVAFTAVNSSGKGQLVFQDSTGKDVLTSPVLTGAAGQSSGAKVYQYSFAPSEFAKLTDGAAYTLLFRDTSGAEESLFFEKLYTYVATHTPLDMTNSSHAYLYWYSADPGDQTVQATIYFSTSDPPKNITAAELEAFKKFTLSNGTDTFAVTDYALDEARGYRSEYRLTLDKPLSVGEYQVYFDGQLFDDFKVYKGDATPFVWADGGEGGNASSGYLMGRNLPTDSTYTAKLYDGYECLTPQPVPLTLGTSSYSDTTQYLYFDRSIFNGLEAGTYQMRVYMDGKLINSGETNITYAPAPLPTIRINDDDGDYQDYDDPVLHTAKIRIDGSNLGEYAYARWAESEEDLTKQTFDPFRANAGYVYMLKSADGPLQFFVELSKTGRADDTDTLRYPFSRWLCTAKDYDLQVPEQISGVHPLASWESYTIQASTAVPATNLWVAFYDVTGKHACQRMEYVGPTDDGRYAFELTFSVGSGFFDYDAYEGKYYYKDTRSIKVFATDLSTVYNQGECYRGNIIGDPVERTLSFVDPNALTLPQFTSPILSINTDTFELIGYCKPSDTIRVARGETELATTKVGKDAMFSVMLTDLEEGQNELTVTWAENFESKTIYINVDTVAPVIDNVGFNFLADGAATLNWVCEDTDVRVFRVYKNSTLLGETKATTTGQYSYSVTAASSDGNSFTIEAEDQAGNVSKRAVSTADQQPPTAPTSLTVSGVTTTTAALQWTAGTDNIGVKGYHVLVDGKQRTHQPITDLTYTVDGLKQGTSYRFAVVTVDLAGNTSAENATAQATTAKLGVSCTMEHGFAVTDEAQTLAIPVTVTATSDVTAYAPSIETVTLQYQDAAATSADWLDGELTVEPGGTTSTCSWTAPVDPTALPQTYRVRLTVTDSKGATATSDVQTVTLSEGRVSITVKDTTTNALIDGASVALYQDGKLVTHAVTNAQGVAKLNAPDGTYSLMAQADGYQPRDISSMTISESKRSFTLYLSTEDILQVETKVKEMGYDEIVAAGIDPSAPGNQHVFQSTVVLEFGELTYCYNDEGQVVSATPTTLDDRVFYPVAKDIFLIVPSESTWLKENFDVQLLVTNTSVAEHVTDCVATLELPDGLSLATMATGEQSDTVKLGTISPKECATHHWYVRGDAKGAYTLRGVVTGTRTTDDFSEAVRIPFTTQDPIQVLAGDAMHMTITAEKTAVTGKPYRMRFELRNVSEKPIYNVDFDVLGGLFRKSYSITDLLASYDLEGPFRSDADNSELTGGFTLHADTFEPTDVLSGVFTITFAQGLNEPDNVKYMLKQVFTFTGGGSTTEIPITIELVDTLDDHVHRYGEGKVTKEPTCTEQGTMTYTCTLDGCDETMTTVIPALGHDMGAWTITKAATCTETGTATRTCTRCGLTETKTLSVLGHDFAETWTVDRAPTCTEPGSESRHCSRCDATTDARPIPATGHTSTVTDCTKDDICAVCGAVIRPAGTHTWGEWTVTKQPTCTEVGAQTHTCTVCGETAKEAIPALGHDYVATVTAPTCTAKGYTTHTCSRCGDHYTDSETDPLGHDWGDWVVTKEATETEDGARTRTCKRCGETETEVISKWPKQALSWPFVIQETVTYPYGSIPILATATNATVDGGAVTYASSDPTVATVDDKGIVTLLNAGTTTITATAAAVPGQYAKTEIQYQLVITKAPLTITANDHAITYGQKPASAGFTANGLKNGEDASVLTGEATYTCTYQQFDKAGTYPIEIAGLTSNNYEIRYQPGTLTVNKATDYTITLDGLKQSMAGRSPVTATIAPQDSSAKIVVEYQVNDAWTTDLPAAPGSYSVRARLVSSDNIVPADAKTATGTLVLEKGAYVATGDDAVAIDVKETDDLTAVEIELTDKALEEIGKNTDGDATIDLDGLEGVKQLTLPTELISTLADRKGTTTISTEDTSITLSQEAMETIADEAADATKIVLRMEAVKEKDLNEEQKLALESLSSVKPVIVDLTLELVHADGKTEKLSELGGNVDIRVPYTVPDGMEGQTAVACYISADGYVTYIRAQYKNGAIEFTTDHFSHYLVGMTSKHVVAVNGGTGGGLYDADVTVTIKADSKSGYRFSKWEVKAGNVTLADATKSETTFTMPSTDVELTATYDKLTSGGGGGGGSSAPSYPVSVPSAEGGSVAVTPSKASKGDKVTLTVKPSTGYTLRSLTVTDQNGDTIETTASAAGKYTFTMPASKVTIEVRFDKIAQQPATGFVDVPAGAFYADAVQWAVEKGITTGTTATTFAPAQTCDRGQMVTFLWRAMGRPEPTGTTEPFTDVDSSSYYAKAVQWAVEKGITKGITATTFAPEQTCDRGQMAAFLYRCAGSPAADSSAAFTDVTAGSYYSDAVAWAVANGVTNGTSATTFSPRDDCTRAQIVTFLYRYLSK